MRSICNVQLQYKPLSQPEIKKYTKAQIEISCVNELFGAAHIHLDCTLHSSYLPHPFAFTSFPFDRLICFEKDEKVLDRKGWALYSEFLLYCYLSDFFHGTLLARLLLSATTSRF